MQKFAKLTIQVTKTFLPPLSEYMAQVERAYNNVWLTNRGELVRELETKVTEFLGLTRSKMICMNNGTTPLRIAIKLLAEGGEVITTPFSYVATTAAIVWENCTPVFVDIHPDFLTIDERLIEAAITERTTCILATHVFGNPCNVEEIERIAQKHNLRVIYDAAHCFGVTYNGKSIFEFGDVSTCSFHATKVFHTGEGGAFFCADDQLFRQAFYSHNSGHNGPLDFYGLGINAKISELQAAMGLALLPYIDQILSERQRVVRFYDENLNFSELNKLIIRPKTEWNFSYYPVLFRNEEQLLMVDLDLKKEDIACRRYFYPSLNTLRFVDGNSCPVSEDAAGRVMCLPLYPDLSDQELRRITAVINKRLLN